MWTCSYVAAKEKSDADVHGFFFLVALKQRRVTFYWRTLCFSLTVCTANILRVCMCVTVYVVVVVVVGGGHNLCSA